MLRINPIGDITITNDGATILHDMSIEHPAAKMVVEVAENSLEGSAGDGTTSAVVFTGSLLEKAENLIENGVHPTVIVKGYRLAAEKAVEILENTGNSGWKRRQEAAYSGCKNFDYRESL